MKVNEIIELANNKNYLVLDAISYESNKYYYCVEVDREDLPTTEYKYLKEIKENEETYVEEVTDENTKKVLTALFSINHLNNTNEEQEN